MIYFTVNYVECVNNYSSDFRLKIYNYYQNFKEDVVICVCLGAILDSKHSEEVSSGFTI